MRTYEFVWVYHLLKLATNIALSGTAVISQDNETSITDDELLVSPIFNYLPDGRLTAKGCGMYILLCVYVNTCV